MTSAELLVPRFEVIEKYPNSGYTIGEVLYNELNIGFYKVKGRELLNGPTIEQLREYPHLFREMKWWEQRIKEQMPKAIISPYGEVYEIVEWYMDELVGISRRKFVEFSTEVQHHLILVDYLPYDKCTHKNT